MHARGTVLLKLNPASKAPAFRQICEAVAALIEAGVLRRRAPDADPHARAPARAAPIDGGPRAYEELRALGWLDARSGAYSTVRGRVRALAPREAEAELTPRFDWAVLVTHGARAAHALGVARRAPAPPARAPAEAPIDLERLAADPSLAPADALRRCFRSALVTDAPDVFDYGDPAGLRPLREAIARRMRAHGVSADVDEVLITAGAQHALDLALRALAREGDENRRRGADVRRRPRAAARARRPSNRDPNGRRRDRSRRARAGAAATPAPAARLHDAELPRPDRRHDLAGAPGAAPLAVRAPPRANRRGRLRGGAQVLRQGGAPNQVDGSTRRRALRRRLLEAPLRRRAWLIVAPRALDRAAETSLLHASSLAVGSVTQAALARFCRGRELEEHLRRAHRVYRRRMSTLLRALEAHLPAEVAFTRPAGGYTSWLTVPGARDDEPRLLAALAEAGVRLAPGSRFFGAPPPTLHARLSIACVDDARVGVPSPRRGAADVPFDTRAAQRRGAQWAEGRAR